MRKVIKSKEDRQKILVNLDGERNRGIFLIGINTGMPPKEFSTITYREYFKKYTYRDCKLLSEVDQSQYDLPLFSNSYDASEFMNQRSINRIIKQAAEKAGLSEKYKITTESLRKSFYYDLYVSGINLKEITKLLNHPYPDRTKEYLEITNSDIAGHLRSYIEIYLDTKEENANDKTGDID